MADLAQILGVPASAGDDKKNDGPLPPPPPPPPPSRALQKLQGQSREVLGLLKDHQATAPVDAAAGNANNAHNTAPLPPSVPNFMGSPAGVGGNAAGDAVSPYKRRLLAHPHEDDAVKVGNRWIKMQTPARPWTWAPFSSSSRTDGTLFHHWVRANVEYPDYPYARFDIHLDPVSYTPAEYQRYLQSDSWTQSETDRLLELARRLELRWPVIYDRWLELAAQEDDEDDKAVPRVERKVEDLQFRFYQVAAVLNQVAIQQEAANEAQMLANAAANAAAIDAAEDGKPPQQSQAQSDNLLYETAAARQLASLDGAQQPLICSLGTGTTNKVFDLHYERQRRNYWQAVWERTPQQQEEERALRQELKQIEAQLRKLKKAGTHVVAAQQLQRSSSSRNNSRSVSPVPTLESATGAAGTSSAAAASQAYSGGVTAAAAAAALASSAAGGGNSPFDNLLDRALASTAPVPTPGTPYLQSGRLLPPATGGSTGINKTLLTKVHLLLHDLKVLTGEGNEDFTTLPTCLLPTKRVCDLYDSVRKNIVTLLLVQKNVLQKEGLLQSKRLRLHQLDPTAAGASAVTEEAVMGLLSSSSPSSPSPAATPPPPSLAPSPIPAASRSTKTATSSGGKTIKGLALSASATLSAKSQATSTKQPKTGKKAAPGLDVDVTTGNKQAAASKQAAQKQATAQKQAAASVAKQAAAAAKQSQQTAAGKQTPAAAGKQVPGAKQAKKAAPKRKRKADAAKSPVPATTGYSQPTQAQHPAMAQPQQQTPPLETNKPASAKKRPRK